MGEEGFSSDSSLLYHRHIPSAIAEAREWELPDQAPTPNSPLLPRHLLLHKLFPDDDWHADRRSHRTSIGAGQCGRADLVRRSPSKPSPLYRNAVGDECVYVEDGAATVETVFGALTVAPGDYVIMPAGHNAPLGADRRRTAARVCDRGELATSRRRSGTCRGSASSSSTRRTASETCAARRNRCSVEGRRRGLHQASRRRPGDRRHDLRATDASPFDVVGWDGCLYPYMFNIADFEPITGRVHQPPPVHQVFRGQQLRDLQLRAAQGRLPPAVRCRCRTTTPTSTPMR